MSSEVSLHRNLKQISYFINTGLQIRCLQAYVQGEDKDLLLNLWKTSLTLLNKKKHPTEGMLQTKHHN